MCKIFCIGSNKTGTTTLTQMLKVLGYRVCPENIMYNFGSTYFIDQLNKKYNNLFNLVQKYDAFEDRPWNHGSFYKDLYEKFPDSKFILTIRNTDNWIESYRRWNKKIKLDKQWFYPLISELCYGNKDFLNDEELMRKIYEERNNEIINFFKDSDKLLIMDLEKTNSYDEICKFLNKEIIKDPFPHLNKTK